MTDEYKERFVELFGQDALEWMLANRPEGMDFADTLSVGHSERLVRVDVTVRDRQHWRHAVYAG